MTNPVLLLFNNSLDKNVNINHIIFGPSNTRLFVSCKMFLCIKVQRVLHKKNLSRPEHLHIAAVLNLILRSRG